MQTVLGPIAPEDLGPTLMHEHLLCDIRHPSQRKPEALGPELALDNAWAINYGTVKRAARNYLLDDRDVAVDEVARMVEVGGLISHDICYRSRLVHWGGHGYGHLFANVVPLMRRRGFSETEIDAILVDNPRRLLTLDEVPPR